MATEPKCAKCGHPQREHSINGACYGICGEFVSASAAPDPSILLDLAERCERATGADWQLSRDIFKAIGGLPDVWCGSKVISWFGNGPWGCNTEDGLRHLHCTNAPAYTSSIDAAMTLLPPNRSVIQYWIVGKKPSVSIQGIDENEPDIHCNASTKELALCAAFLRSLALRTRSTDTGGK